MLKMGKPSSKPDRFVKAKQAWSVLKDVLLNSFDWGDIDISTEYEMVDDYFNDNKEQMAEIAALKQQLHELHEKYMNALPSD